MYDSKQVIARAACGIEQYEREAIGAKILLYFGSWVGGCGF
ncbi:hypothetical protein [Candidatus Coxiella mudrowiae]|nr:hypothetical protein [Candidatus Coxiella mudrowiae]